MPRVFADKKCRKVTSAHHFAVCIALLFGIKESTCKRWECTTKKSEGRAMLTARRYSPGACQGNMRTHVCERVRDSEHAYVYNWLTACAHLDKRTRRSSHFTSYGACSESEITRQIWRALSRLCLGPSLGWKKHSVWSLFFPPFLLSPSRLTAH